MIFDTICALGSAANEAGIGIIRISGDKAIEIAEAFCKNKSGKDIDISESHRIKYSFIYDDGEAVDEVLVLTMRAPRSYTGEDTVEIDCHGSVLMMRKILDIAVKHGARLAEPGEFTKRAFLNGRIDLSEAEAVSDIISSKNDYALKASISQLRGSVSEEIERLREIIITDIAGIEASLDDPEHINLDGFDEKIKSDIDDIMSSLNKLIDSSTDGKFIKEGIRTVIVGKPNAGKSSFLNLILGEERAIVSDIAGTTRDTLEESISLGGVSLNIVDTAGIRNTDDTIEKIGVERALKAAEDADLIIYVVDSSMELDESDESIIDFIKDRKAIILMNKSDLKPVISLKELKEITGKSAVSISAKTGSGLDEVEKLIKDMFYRSEIDFNDQVLITNLRHKNLLINARDAITHLEESVNMSMPEDFYTIDLMSAYEELGYIIGKEVSEDLVNEIFSKFCMGK